MSHDRWIDESERLDLTDLNNLADEGTRMGLSLACLIGALVDGSPILWMAEEKPMRDYTTWEEDFSSDEVLLRGYNDELVATVKPLGGSWTVTDAAGTVVAFPDKASAQKAATALLEPAKAR